jgi:hypothetical protein
MQAPALRVAVRARLGVVVVVAQRIEAVAQQDVAQLVGRDQHHFRLIGRAVPVGQFGNLADDGVDELHRLPSTSRPIA